MAAEEHSRGLSRRGFVTGVVAALGGVIAVVIGLPAIGYLISPGLQKSEEGGWVPIGPVDELPAGEPVLFTFTLTKQVGWERSAVSQGVYVTRRPNDDYYVFSNICTHLSCRVKWDEPDEHYICPCHDGRFARDGSIVSGPQPRALYEYNYKIEEGTMYVDLGEVT